MAETALIFDPANNLKSGIEEVLVLSWDLVDRMYVRTEHGLQPKAYIYPARHRTKLEALFVEYRAAKQLFDETAARIFYQELPKLT